MIYASARRRSARALERECDKLAREIVFIRDRHTCQKTGKTTNLQWCHVVTRGYKRLKWDPDNSLCLNAGAHLWWHHHPLEATAWFQTKWPDRAKRLLMARQDRSGGKLDREAMLLWLKQQRAKLEG